jgi:hypothetical protein
MQELNQNAAKDANISMQLSFECMSAIPTSEQPSGRCTPAQVEMHFLRLANRSSTHCPAQALLVALTDTGGGDRWTSCPLLVRSAGCTRVALASVQRSADVRSSLGMLPPTIDPAWVTLSDTPDDGASSSRAHARLD